MLEITDLSLTPPQYREVSDSDPALVAAWLVAANSGEIRNPAGFFLTGLRSGEPPFSSFQQGNLKSIRLAEQWVERVGCLYDREEQVVDELFGRYGILRAEYEDQMLRRRLVVLWERLRPLGEQVEQEQRERAVRNAATYEALHREKPV